MRSEENRALVRRYYEEVVNTGAVDKVPFFVSPDTCLTSVLSGRIMPGASVEADVRSRSNARSLGAYKFAK